MKNHDGFDFTLLVLGHKYLSIFRPQVLNSDGIKFVQWPDPSINLFNGEGLNYTHHLSVENDNNVNCIFILSQLRKDLNYSWLAYWIEDQTIFLTTKLFIQRSIQ